MNPEARRAISKRGGEASHESGRGHEFNSEEAREAGRLGGEARWGNRASRSTLPAEDDGRTTFRSLHAEDLDGELGRRGSSSPNPGGSDDVPRRGGEASGRSRGSRAR